MESAPDWGANLANAEANTANNTQRQDAPAERDTQPPTTNLETQPIQASDKGESQQVQAPLTSERQDAAPERADVMDVDEHEQSGGGGEQDQPPAPALDEIEQRREEMAEWIQGLTNAEVEQDQRDVIAVAAPQGGLQAPPPDEDDKRRDDTADLTQNLANVEAKQSDVIEVAAPPETEQQAASTERKDEAQPTEMEVDDPESFTPDPFSVSLRDSAIKCVCSPGTIRLAKDIVFMGVSKDGPRFTHLPCKPYIASMPEGSAEQIEKLVRESTLSGQTFNPGDLVKKILGHDLNKKQQLLTKNYTSRFHCDGPCPGTKHLSEYFMCEKCCAWQHKSCMLYGDEQDRGGPVCNPCYINFVVNHEEITAWQRKRLLMVAKECWNYLSDPENSHQEWRRAWCRAWLARFFAKVRHTNFPFDSTLLTVPQNQVVFHRYIAARKQAQRIAAAREYMSRVQTVPQGGESQSAAGDGEDGDYKSEDEKPERREPTRKQPKRKSAPVEALLDAADLDEDMEEPEQEDDDGADSDEIIVAPKKSKPAPATTKKSSGKRKAMSPISSPVNKKSKPEVRSRAPRKSAPSFGQFGAGFWDDDDDNDDIEPDDDELNDVSLLEASRNRRREAPLPPANISCRCKGKAPTLRECFKCRDCGIHQHRGCAWDVQDGLSIMCNYCFSRGPMQSPEPPTLRQPAPLPEPPKKKTQAPASASFMQPPKPALTAPTMQPPPKPQPAASFTQPATSFMPPPAAPSAPAPPQQTIQPEEQYDPALRDEVNHLCATTLWREYCSIPMPSDDSSDEDAPPKSQPPASAIPPPDWLADCQDKLLKLLTACGQEKTAAYLQPVLAAWPRQNALIMKALRDLALEEINNGSYKGKRRRLGVVLEVLGLEEKGRFFKG